MHLSVPIGPGEKVRKETMARTREPNAAYTNKRSENYHKVRETRGLQCESLTVFSLLIPLFCHIFLKTLCTGREAQPNSIQTKCDTSVDWHCSIFGTFGLPIVAGWMVSHFYQ